MEVRFKVPGEPIGKQRVKFSRQGSFVRSYTPDKTVNYGSLVGWAYTESCGPLKFAGAISVDIRLYFAIPKSVSKKKRAEMLTGVIRPTKRPDTDNCIKSILDGLNKIAYDDDAQVVVIIAAKYYAEVPRAEITITEIGGQ